MMMMKYIAQIKISDMLLLCGERLYTHTLYTDCHFFAEVGHVTSQVEYILAGSVACVTNELAIFPVDIDPMHPHMTSQTCCRPTYFIREFA